MSPKSGIKRLKGITIVVILSWILLVSAPTALASQDPNSKPGVFTDPATGRLVDIVTSDPKGPQPPDPDSLPEKEMKNLPSPGNEEAFSLFAVVVYINEPCDEEWRARYGANWMYWANYAVLKLLTIIYTSSSV